MANTSTTGAAGEHYVMCQLLRKGLIAALAPTGVPNADIIVTDQIGDKLCAVQVKTRIKPGSDKGWHMSAKHEEIKSPNIYYCFVGFESDPPGCWIVPSAIVAECSNALTRIGWHLLAKRGSRTTTATCGGFASHMTTKSSCLNFRWAGWIPTRKSGICWKQRRRNN